MGDYGQEYFEDDDELDRDGNPMPTAQEAVQIINSIPSYKFEAAKMEENEYNTPWSIAQGITAHARTITHTDARVEMERAAGKILDFTLNKA